MDKRINQEISKNKKILYLLDINNKENTDKNNEDSDVSFNSDDSFKDANDELKIREMT